MKIVPTKAEVTAVEKILESFEDFADDRDMSKAIVKAVFEQLTRRESYCVALRSAGSIEAYWPFLYESDAVRFNQLHPGLDGERRYILRMRSPVIDLETAQRHTLAGRDRIKDINWPHMESRPK